MPQSLANSAVAQFRTDGYYLPVEAFTGADAAALRAELQEIEAAYGGALRGRHRVKGHLLFPFMQRIIRHDPILDAVEVLIGPNILCWTTNLFIKEAHDPSFVPWHQDAAYWGLDRAAAVTAWVALTDSTPANGNVRVARGTHGALVKHEDTYAESSALPKGQEIQVAVDESLVVDLTLRAGQMSLHHPLIHHGSGPNTSEDRRIGVAIRYVSTSVRQVVGETDSATLVRGTDRYGHFEPEPEPSRDWDPPLLALHERLTARTKSRADTARRQWSDFVAAFRTH